MSPRPILKPFPAPPLFLDLHSGAAHSANPDLCTPYNGALPFASCHIPPAMSPHVHFPATPALTQCEITYSSRSYDRKPIEVLPNALGLPARGERDVDHGYFYPVRRYAVPESNDMDVDYSPPRAAVRSQHPPICHPLSSGRATLSTYLTSLRSLLWTNMTRLSDPLRYPYPSIFLPRLRRV